MASWIWVLIPLVAIIGAYFIDYQNNKLKWQAQTSSNEQELEGLQTELKKLTKRIENLEAIAASEETAGSSYSAIEMDMGASIKKENESIIAQKAKQKGG